MTDLEKLKPEQFEEVLRDALDYMQQYNGRTVQECIDHALLAAEGPEVGKVYMVSRRNLDNSWTDYKPNRLYNEDLGVPHLCQFQELTREEVYKWIACDDWQEVWISPEGEVMSGHQIAPDYTPAKMLFVEEIE